MKSTRADAGRSPPPCPLACRLPGERLSGSRSRCRELPASRRAQRRVATGVGCGVAFGFGLAATAGASGVVFSPARGRAAAHPSRERTGRDSSVTSPSAFSRTLTPPPACRPEAALAAMAFVLRREAFEGRVHPAARRLGLELEAAALGDLEPHVAVRRAGGDLRVEHATRREPRAAALDLDVDRSREAVERDVRPGDPDPSAVRETLGSRGRRARPWPRPRPPPARA